MVARSKQLAWATAVCLCCAMAGAANPAEATDPAAQSRQRFHCAGDQWVTVLVDQSDPEQIRSWVSVEGDPQIQQVEMRHVPYANGFKSSNGRLVWWTRGDEGFLMEEYPPAGNGQMLLDDCRAVLPEE